jgi:hypothetical protein
VTAGVKSLYVENLLRQQVIRKFLGVLVFDLSYQNGKTLGRRWAYQVRLLAQIACICQTKYILVDTLATMLAEGPVAMQDPPVQDLLNHEISGLGEHLRCNGYITRSTYAADDTR